MVIMKMCATKQKLRTFNYKKINKYKKGINKWMFKK